MADIFTQNKLGNTELHIAIENQDITKVENILNSLQNNTDRIKLLSLQNNSKRTPFYTACEQKNMSIIKLLLIQLKQLNNMRDVHLILSKELSGGSTAMLILIDGNEGADALDAIFKLCKDKLYPIDDNTLQTTYYSDAKELIYYMLTAPGYNRQTILHLLAGADKDTNLLATTKLKELVAHELNDLSAKDTYELLNIHDTFGDSIINIAITNHDVDLLKDLFRIIRNNKQFLEVCSIKDRDGNTSLHLILKAKNKEMINSFFNTNDIESLKQLLAIHNNDNKSPFNILSGDLTILSPVLDTIGSSPELLSLILTFSNGNGNNIMHSAILGTKSYSQNDVKTIFKSVEQHDQKFIYKLLNTQNNNGKTVLDLDRDSKKNYLSKDLLLRYFTEGILAINGEEQCINSGYTEIKDSVDKLITYYNKIPKEFLLTLKTLTNLDLITTTHLSILETVINFCTHIESTDTNHQIVNNKKLIEEIRKALPKEFTEPSKMISDAGNKLDDFLVSKNIAFLLLASNHYELASKENTLLNHLPKKGDAHYDSKIVDNIIDSKKEYLDPEANKFLMDIEKIVGKINYKANINNDYEKQFAEYYAIMPKSSPNTINGFLSTILIHNQNIIDLSKEISCQYIIEVERGFMTKDPNEIIEKIKNFCQKELFKNTADCEEILSDFESDNYNLASIQGDCYVIHAIS